MIDGNSADTLLQMLFTLQERVAKTQHPDFNKQYVDSTWIDFSPELSDLQTKIQGSIDIVERILERINE